MTDDIVTRLREYSKGHSSILYNDTQDAADEIERLRADVARWRAAAEAVWYADDDESVAQAHTLYEIAEARGE